jgi:hypothetical protein
MGQDLTNAGIAIGVEIMSTILYKLGDEAGIREVVAAIGESVARVIVVIAYDSDLPAIAAAADEEEMLTPGYAWVLNNGNNIHYAVESSPNPEKTRKQLEGWMMFFFQPFYGEAGLRFQHVFENEPFQHLAHPVFEGGLTEEIVSSPCDFFCGLIYDAVWTAAIAIGRVGVAADGSVDKAALLRAIRNVSFDGATGRVRFDPETGERDPKSLPLLLLNLRPSQRRDGEPSLSPVLTWQFWQDAGEQGGRLEEKSDEPPVWPGGARSWTPPQDRMVCPDGHVYQRSTLRCEPCPPGSRLLVDRCEECEVGTFSAEAGAAQCSRCQVGFANETGQTACHACPANTVRSAASHGVSITECLCVVGFYSLEGPGHACRECVSAPPLSATHRPMQGPSVHPTVCAP